MLIVGIDPGWSGGIARVGGGRTVCNKFTGYTEKDIVTLLQSFLKDADACYLEKVHAMPGNGVASMFKFGTIYGGLLFTILASGVPLYHVTPQKWQRSLNCLTKGDKNVSKRRAQELYPGIKVTHATADALLIAQYGYDQRRTDTDYKMFSM